MQFEVAQGRTPSPGTCNGPSLELARSRPDLLKLVWDQLETQSAPGQEIHSGAVPFPERVPGERLRDILTEAPGKAASGAVMTDVFLLPFGDAGREGLGRERLPRWVALRTRLQEEVERKSFSYVPTDLSPQAFRKIPAQWLTQAFSFPPGK